MASPVATLSSKFWFHGSKAVCFFNSAFANYPPHSRWVTLWKLKLVMAAGPAVPHPSEEKTNNLLLRFYT